ncbi:hypothetical protein CVT25_012093, partial [Psilocybe cyanescens]
KFKNLALRTQRWLKKRQTFIDSWLTQSTALRDLLNFNRALLACTEDERQLFVLKALAGAKPSFKAEPKLCDVIITFVLMKRTDRQMERLLTRSSEYGCRMDEQGGAIRRYHELGEEMEKLLLSRFLDEYDASEATNGLSVVPRTFDGARCVRIKTAAKGSASSWPVATTDLIPFGADHLVQTMLQWYRFLPDTIVFRVMAFVLRVCQSLVIPSLIKYKFTDVVVQSTRLMVDRTMVELPLENPLPLHTLSRFNWHAVDFLTCLGVNMHEVEQDYKAALFRGCETCNSALFYSTYPRK